MDGLKKKQRRRGAMEGRWRMEWSARVQQLLPAASLIGSLEVNREERWRLRVGCMGKTRWIWEDPEGNGEWVAAGKRMDGTSGLKTRFASLYTLVD